MPTRTKTNPELVQALRQCDGGRVQCIVMVRDDFWLAVSRFMLDLEVDLVPGRNIALVDLFDLDHARKILAAFGRAFGRLPENRGETSREQKDFLEQVVKGLAEEGKVVCVRLALFAEMMKGKPWTPATLKEVGGTQGDRRHFSGRDVQRQDGKPQTPPAPEGGPGRPRAPCCPNRAPTSRATCGPTRNCSKCRAMPAALRTSTN